MSNYPPPAVHPSRPPCLELRPHPLRETQIERFLRNIAATESQLWAASECGLRPPINLLRQELSGTGIYLDFLQKSTYGFETNKEKRPKSDGFQDVDSTADNDLSITQHSDAEEKFERVAEEKLEFRMQLDDTIDTTTHSYWLNWRVYLCAVSVLLSMVAAFLIIWKHEGSRNFTSDKGENQQDRTLSGDEAWKPCLKDIHPICLLAFRVIAFSSLLASLIAKIHISSGLIFYYYTQWTFTLVTIYFGCASILSVYGCYQYKKSTSTTFDDNYARIDAEQGPYMPLLHQDPTNLCRIERHADPHIDIHKNQVASIWSYVLQILFQINAGAVMLTDCVYWLIIFPFLTLRDYDLNFMTVNMHTLNVILLLGDAALNCLRVPWFGMSFFVIWTGVYVIFQWTIHACVSIWWPYPFLDLSSPYAPLWNIRPCGKRVLPVHVRFYSGDVNYNEVLGAGIAACSMLWLLYADGRNETLFLVKMVPFLLSVLKIGWYQSWIPLELNAVWPEPKLHSALPTAKWMVGLCYMPMAQTKILKFNQYGNVKLQELSKSLIRFYCFQEPGGSTIFVVEN
ncbi:hypothetical protein SESBI_20645 [Sesbania bispinosa]|nr:hypothetical protein SESBI_20645 [Sesbania bispinosa]